MTSTELKWAFDRTENKNVIVKRWKFQPTAGAGLTTMGTDTTGMRSVVTELQQERNDDEFERDVREFNRNYHIL